MPKLTSRGRVTIPIKVRRALGVGPGSRIEFIHMKEGRFVMVALARQKQHRKDLVKKR